MWFIWVGYKTIFDLAKSILGGDNVAFSEEFDLSFRDIIDCTDFEMFESLGYGLTLIKGDRNRRKAFFTVLIR